jgi:hypothetical protein
MGRGSFRRGWITVGFLEAVAFIPPLTGSMQGTAWMWGGKCSKVMWNNESVEA